MRGRRTPTAVKKAQGTYDQYYSVPDEMQPPVFDGIPGVPELIAANHRASSLWVETVKVLSDLGILSSIHLPAIAAYCMEMSTYWEAREVVQREGKVEIATTSGYRMANPWIAIGNRALENAMKLGAKFGLYPVDASKISAKPKGDDEDSIFK